VVEASRRISESIAGRCSSRLFVFDTRQSAGAIARFVSTA
jgi:hypothetical protein